MATYDNKSFGSIYVNKPILILVQRSKDVLRSSLKDGFLRDECCHQII